MENASNALIMAGEILIAILVLGALLLMFNELSSYQKSQSDIDNASQLAQFNAQFTQYARNDVQGVELISLMNKIVAYNRRTDIYGEIDYNIKITLEVTLTGQFQTKCGGTLNKYQIQTPYTITGRDSEFYKIADEYRLYESKYTADVLSLMYSNQTSIENGEKLSSDFTTDGQPFRLINSDGSEGENIEGAELIEFLEQYSEYSSLKSSTFTIEGEPTYTNNQISGMKFRYVR